MADEEEVPQESGDAKSKKSMMVLVMIGGLMLAEGAGVFVLARMTTSAPSPAEAAMGLAEDEQADVIQSTEVEVADLNAYNSKTGRVFVYHMTVSASIDTDDLPAVKTFLEERKNAISDHLNRIIRSAEPDHLDETGLETIRRQIKFELDKLIGDETMIKEIFIPYVMKSRADF